MDLMLLSLSIKVFEFKFTPAGPGQYSHRSVRRWMSTIDTFQSDLPIPFFTVRSNLIESVRMMSCVV